MNKRTLKRIFNKKKKQLGIPEARLIVRPMNKKLATASIKTNTVTFNKKILERISKEEAEAIIIHELIHLRLKESRHTVKFYDFQNNKLKEWRWENIIQKIVQELR